MLQKIFNEKKLFVIYISAIILLIGAVFYGTLAVKSNVATQNAKAQSVITSQDSIALVSEEFFVFEEKKEKNEDVSESVVAERSNVIEVEKAVPLTGNYYVDENGIKWCDIYVEVGNISEEERDHFTEFFQKNDGGHFLHCDFDKPQDVDLSTIFYGAWTGEWNEKEVEESEFDAGYIPKSEVDGKLMKFLGLTNEQMTIPLFINNVNGVEVAAWEASDWLSSCPICLGGYKDGDTYTLLMSGPLSVVTLKKNANDTIAITSNYTLDYYFNLLDGDDYNPNEKYTEKSFSSVWGKNELELLKNEYYARHGMIFDDPVMKLYFEAMNWYEPSITSTDFDESVFNEVEKANLSYIEEKLKATEMVEAYQKIASSQKNYTMALIYLDEDSIPELLFLKDGEYKLYTFNAGEVKGITMPSAEIKANAYGPRHDFEDSEELMFYWFEYVPYKGLIRVHGGSEEERYDYYLKYEDGSFIKELKTESKDYKWYTYAGENEVDSKVFLEQMEALGYNELVPCAYLYEDVSSAYENINRESDTKKALDDFVSGKTDALCYVEEITDIPEDGFFMSNFEEIYEDITCGEEWWGKLEYVDFDNDGEEELVIHGYCGSKMFFDIIGDTVYLLLKTSSTTDVASVAEIDNTRVIERTDLTHGGRKYYEIMQYDACACLVERFWLFAAFEGGHYTESDRFEYNGEAITMKEFEAIVDSIERVDSDTARSFFNKYHIEVDNKIYFRQYSADSIQEGDVLGCYSEVKSAPKRLVSLDEDGKLTEVFEDNGYGSIYLLEDRFFSQCMTQGGSRVYSCNLTGKNKTMWSSWEILDQAEAGFLICKTNDDGLAIIDSIEEKIVVEEAVQYQGCFDNIIYFSIQKKDTVELHSVDSEGNKKHIISVSVKDVTSKGTYYSDTINIGGLDVCGEYMAFAAGDYQSEGAYYGGTIVLCKLNGTEKTLFYSESSSHSFYNEGNKTAFLYEQDGEVKWEELSVEMFETFQQIPTYGVLDAYHSVSGYIMHSDWKETYLYENEYEELLTEIEKTQKYQYDYHEIRNAEIIDNKLFFNIVLEKADPSKDIGWRAYYERVATYEYVKDLGNREIRLLYAF